MSHRLYSILLLLSLLASLTVAPFNPAPEAEDPFWEVLAPGIDYRKFYLPGPNLAYVARMDRSAPDVTLESSIGQGRLSGGAETVREQAARYDDAINYWGEVWGNRSQVIAAINGSYFDTLTGIPWSGQVQSGWYARRFEDRQNTSGFAWTLDRQAFIGACVMHRPGKQQITFAGKLAVGFDGINVIPGENDLIVYTPHYDARTPGMKKGLDILVELSQPLTILPEPNSVPGVVRQVIEDQGNTPIPFDHIVIAAQGKAYEALKGKISPGDAVGISQELRHLTSDCQQPNPDSWTKAYASISGGYLLLQHGQVQALSELGAILRNPRTAIALNDQYIFFIVVDGRDRLRSQGMSMVELAVFAKMELGAAWAIVQDGGGSSTMVINGEVVNRPNADLADTVQPATPSPESITPTAAQPPEAKTVERAVANGMMMVVVRPRELSSRFESGQDILVEEDGPVNLRLGPGTNFAVLDALPPGSRGVILPHALNGVRARGYAWWKVEINGVTGWVNEESLAPAG